MRACATALLGHFLARFNIPCATLEEDEKYGAKPELDAETSGRAAKFQRVTAMR